MMAEEKKFLRELGNREFRDVYHCDRFTATILSSGYRYMVQRMCRGLQRTAFSIILRDWYDVGAALTRPPPLN